MAITPQIRVSQAGIQAVAEGEVDIRVSQAGTMVVGVVPTEFVQLSQAGVQVVTEADTDIRLSQAGIMVVARGRVQSPYLRVFTFELDGHWFWVCNLPTGYTLVYDVYAQQWYIWGSGDGSTWRPFHGTNWLGCGPLMQTYGSNVVAGDDGNGTLYMLNPSLATDDDALQGSAGPRPFLRQVTGQVTTRSRDYISCYGVRLGGSVGENDASLTEVTLYVSDDDGHTYDDMGTVTVEAGDYVAGIARVDWDSGLGSYTMPGRLFRIEDYGALQRIDYLEMDGDEDG